MVENNTILLADKDRELCKALEKYLTRHGHDVKQTETGHDALSALSTNPPSVITRLRLPRDSASPSASN